MKAAFTGHRNIDEKIATKAIAILLNEAKNLQVNHFYNGMAWGFDLLTAKMLVEKGLNWTAVCPHRDQYKLWPKKLRLEYQQLLSSASDKIYLFDENRFKLENWQFLDRNKFLVNKCDVLLAYYDGSERGGTKYTVNYAIAKNKKVIIFNPITQELSFKNFDIKPKQLCLL